MNKLFASTLVACLLTFGGVGMASAQADLSLDPHRMLFRYTTPVLDTGDFQVIPGNGALHQVESRKWRGWKTDLGAGSLTSIPGVVAYATGDVHVFARGEDRNVWHTFWTM